jgi:hypothetical protein
LWNADLAHYPIRTRPRGRICNFDFEDEYEDGDEYDVDQNQVS